jgi:hypothetical protein
MPTAHLDPRFSAPAAGPVDWETAQQFDVVDGAFVHADESLPGEDPGSAHAFAVVPGRVFAFGRGEPSSQTRCTFPTRDGRGQSDHRE